ncbi:MAG: thymidylate kinase [Clostridiaceae bacterium]|jgi:dTMP kinase|nr:thymidylate kinase [Clostridiaceae bacterium]
MKGKKYMAGKVWCIDGVDASFKETNVNRLFELLKNEGENIRKLSYPNYKSNASMPVQMYLNGEFGSNANDVNPYSASTFYAVDRYASYKSDWESFYKENNSNIMLLDRYTTANMIHQASKFNNSGERERFLDWLWDLEFVKMGLPIPDKVIFLDMPPEVGQHVNKNRNNKITGKSDKDIHEKDLDYMKKSYENAIWVAEKYKWIKVSCIKSKNFNLLPNDMPDNLKTKEEMLKEIYEKIKIA